jgi:LysM repeat protein
MKKINLSLIIVVLVSSMAHAQSVSFGLRGGINIAKLTFSTSGVSASIDPKVGLMLGTYLTVMTSEKFGIQPELVYSSFGGSFNITNTSGQTVSVTSNYNYLSLPVMLRYNASENISIQAGPQLGLLLSATSSSGSQSIDVKDTLNGIDFGGAFGLGFDFGAFNAGARYYLGLSNIAKNVPTGSDQKVTNSAIQLFVGYTLFKK